MIKRALALSLLLTVVGCGGGGDSGDEGGSASTNTLSFRAVSPMVIDRTFADWAIQNGQFASLMVGYSGVTDKPVYVIVEDPSKVFVNASVGTMAGGSATLMLGYSQTLAPGLYQGTVKVHACQDSQCAVEYPGSPVSIQSKLLVVGLTVDQSALSFSANADEAPAAQLLNVTSQAGTAGLYATLQYGSSFFTFTQQGNQFSVQARALPQGHYEDTLTISVPGYSARQVKLSHDSGPVVAR